MICLMENTIPKPVPFTSIRPTMKTFRQKMKVQFSPPSHLALIHLHSNRSTWQPSSRVTVDQGALLKHVQHSPDQEDPYVEKHNANVHAASVLLIMCKAFTL